MSSKLGDVKGYEDKAETKVNELVNTEEENKKKLEEQQIDSGGDKDKPQEE